MKSLSFLFAIGLLIASTHAQNTNSSSAADLVLSNTHKALQNLKSIKYDQLRELNYVSENYRNLSMWTCYYDFNSTDTLIGFKYQVEDSTSKSVFNGTKALG